MAYTAAKLQAHKPLTIVALGSSSTTGFGTFGVGAPFPDVMKAELLRLRPFASIELINSGRIMENLGDNIARIDDDVLRYKPDLLVWQIGTNDVVWRGIADDAKEMLSTSVKRLKAEKMDVVLMDLQYAPLVLATTRYIRMENHRGCRRRTERRLFSAISFDETGERGRGQRSGLVGRPPQLRPRLQVRRTRACAND